MPGVLTEEGWRVFETQKEADLFKAKLEKERLKKEADEAAKKEAAEKEAKEKADKELKEKADLFEKNKGKGA